MFNFFIRKSTIVIDVYTFIEEVHDLYAPENSSRFVPQWWKELETTYSSRVDFPLIKSTTMKRCVGIIETIKNGFILPLWSDVAINLTKDADQRYYRYHFANQRSVIEHHSSIQYGKFIDTNEIQHLKLVSPWKFKEKTGTMFNLSQPTWHLGTHVKDFCIIPGVTDFKYQNSTNIQMLGYYPETDGTRHILIEAGTPMYHATPLSDKRVVIKKHLISESEWQLMGNAAIKFNNSYKARKDRMDNVESKCPFSRMFK
jgi:hypothetical protein